MLGLEARRQSAPPRLTEVATCPTRDCGYDLAGHLNDQTFAAHSIFSVRVRNIKSCGEYSELVESLCRSVDAPLSGCKCSECSATIPSTRPLGFLGASPAELLRAVGGEEGDKSRRDFTSLVDRGLVTAERLRLWLSEGQEILTLSPPHRSDPLDCRDASALPPLGAGAEKDLQELLHARRIFLYNLASRELRHSVGIDWEPGGTALPAVPVEPQNQGGQ